MTKRFLRSFNLWLMAVAIGLGSAQADEPAEKFLRALRENNYYADAIDYLTIMQDSPLASPQFKRRIKFEMAEVYLDQLGQLRDVAQIEQTIDRADALLAEFAASNPPAELFAESARVRATALFARGKVALTRGSSERHRRGKKGGI